MMTEETDKADNQGSKSMGLGMRMSVNMISKKFSRVTNISTNTLNDWLQKKDQTKQIVLLDCRPEEEYAVSHMSDSIRIDYESDPKDILERILSKVNPVETTIVCYCAAGYRSSLVVDKLQEYYKKTGTKPIGDIYNLEGSIFKWANEGRFMVDLYNKQTPYAHPYNPVFGKLLDSSLRRQKPQNELM